MSDKGSRLHMKSKKQKCTLRLSMDEIEQLESYPGNNFTEKVRSLLAAHAINMDLLDGNDLTEKYETILKGYLSCHDPELLEEIEYRRKELKRYVETIKALDELNCLVNDFKDNIEEMCEQSNQFVEKKVADCVRVRKKTEQEDVN